MEAKSVTVDLAGKDHWDQMWEEEPFPPDVNPRSQSLWGHRDRLFHQTLQRILIGRAAGLSLVELGCARSAWMPYFAREFHYRVSGLDYSALGARQTADRLRDAGIAGEVRCADLFDPPREWIGAFDVVSWFGVAEHFKDTTAAIRTASALLKPSGLIITEIPNMVGLNGWLQCWFNKPVYDIHVPLSAPELAAHHAAAGLRVIASEYVVPLDFGVVDIEELPPGLQHRLKDRVLYLLRLFGGCVWWLDRRIGPLSPGRLTAGFVFVAAEKP
jgi:2-polyprenyl-3-methyl-5-hydroxy-6-metoxy-1,4-benzoquinol methylase